jgi:signal peptidase
MAPLSRARTCRRIVNIDDADLFWHREHRDVSRSKPAPARSPSPAVHRLRQVASWVLGLALLAATAGALTVALYPTVTSGKAMAVLSGSMTPTYPVGAMVFTRPVDPADVAVGDVITFERPSNTSELVTHRVVAVDTSGGTVVFTTKGDANNAADLDPVPASLVQGRLWFGVPQLGRVAAILHSPQGLGFLVLLVCGVAAVSPGKRPEPAVRQDVERDRVPAEPPELEQTASIAVPDVRMTRLPPVPPPVPRFPRRPAA